MTGDNIDGVNGADVLISVEHLVKTFKQPGRFGRGRKVVHAVDDVSLAIRRGRTYGLVGESGCGKSTLGRCVLGMLKPDGGRILFDGADTADPAVAKLLRREGAMQVIYQDPAAALNPAWTVREIVTEPLRVQGYPKREAEARALELMERLSMTPADLDKMPYEFSGGQRQRIGIARAVAGRPRFVFCDEPVSALDVSVRGQVMDLLEQLQDEMGLTYLFTAHDLGVVRRMSDEVGVMYLGRLVEEGPADAVLAHPAHPYTIALVAAVPDPDPAAQHADEDTLIKGDLPSPLDLPSGCRYHPRCPYAAARCCREEPPLKDIAPGHKVACFWAHGEL